MNFKQIYKRHYSPYLPVYEDTRNGRQVVAESKAQAALLLGLSQRHGQMYIYRAGILE